jgi:hypothetical protein
MTKRAPKQQNTAAGQPTVTRNSRRLTDKQRAMVEMRKTATVRETAERFNVPTSQVTWADGFRQPFLTHAQQSATQTNPAADMNIDRIGEALAGHAAGRFAWSLCHSNALACAGL